MRCWMGSWGFACTWESSPGQLIHHSDELCKEYRESIAASIADAGVDTVFASMRSAKHRLETDMRPLSLAALGLTGLIAFGCTVARTRRGQTLGQLANAWLATLIVYIIFILGLMADAGVACLKFIRLIDTGDLPVADL